MTPTNLNSTSLIDEDASLEDFCPSDDPELELIDKAITVSYNAALARLTSIAAATLYNRLCQWTRFKKDLDDGWVYYTAANYAFDTNFSKNTFTKAYKELVDAGLVEQKTTYIRLTRIKACHFRITAKSPRDLYLETKREDSTNHKNEQDRPHKNAKSIYTEVHTEGREDFPLVGKSAPSEHLALDASQASPARLAPKEKEASLPFGANPKEVVSVRPDKVAAEAASAQGRPYAVAKAVLQGWGYQVPKIGAPLAKLVKLWIEAGVKTEEIIEAGKLMKESGDEYWQKATPTQMLSSNGLLWYQTRKLEQNKPKTIEDYRREIAEAQAAEERANDTSFWEAVKKFEAKQRGEL